jgi:chromosome segregation ATPase
VNHTGSDRKLAEPGEPEQPANHMKQLLAKAEQQIGKLQEKVADQKKQVCALKAQAKHEENLTAERKQLKAEIADLKDEIRELTRANREQVEKLETLRRENTKIKADAKVRRPTSLRPRMSALGIAQSS